MTPEEPCEVCNGLGMAPATGNGGDGFDPCPGCGPVERSDEEIVAEVVYDHLWSDVTGCECGDEVSYDMDYGRHIASVVVDALRQAGRIVPEGSTPVPTVELGQAWDSLFDAVTELEPFRFGQDRYDLTVDHVHDVVDAVSEDVRKWSEYRGEEMGG